MQIVLELAKPAPLEREVIFIRKSKFSSKDANDIFTRGMEVMFGLNHVLWWKYDNSQLI